MDYHLILDLPYDLYQIIESQSLFNSEPALRGAHQGAKFDRDRPIQLTVTLKPEYCSHLQDYDTPERVASYLQRLSEAHTKLQESTNEASPTTATEPDPLLQTENWLCLSVKQTQDSGEVGYETFWHHINPHTLYEAATSGGKLIEEATEFLTEWIESNFVETAEETANQLIKEIGQTLETALDRTLTELDRQLEDDPPLLATVKNFFDTEGWPYAESDSETALQLAFEGENGKWTCYAIASEERQDFIFYSLCPVNAPADKRLAMAEFITRANYGNILGNFEMDFDSGDIHYKTSIDVEGDRLSASLLKPLVYTNVAMMDRYLPGILSTIYGDAPSPTASISEEPPQDERSLDPGLELSR
ncbi:YbjN domain-containing protein [Synechococcus sp. PCC 7336]|uniref:YbjN domain-containing protein n=1 Tax=Synechococcus sp. PCC 7336 TaxID=195250 RepID=UPI000346C858|nr:YbjN domain-containing protein [Synechococcus sp. PCC 7336]